MPACIALDERAMQRRGVAGQDAQIVILQVVQGHAPVWLLPVQAQQRLTLERSQQRPRLDRGEAVRLVPEYRDGFFRHVRAGWKHDEPPKVPLRSRVALLQ